MIVSPLPRLALHATRAAVTVSLLLTLLGGAAVFWPAAAPARADVAAGCLPAGPQR